MTARLGSKRLPQKHLQSAGGRPILRMLLDRILHEFSPELQGGKARLFISTADEPENRELEKAFGEANVSVFFGSPGNIPYRHLQNLRDHGLDSAVSVDGDDIFCSPAAMRAVLQGLARGHDLVKTTGLPLGMNACGYTRELLDRSLSLNNPKVLETGWSRIFQPLNPFEARLPMLSGNELLRFTLDYPEDLAFFRKLIERLGPDSITAPDTGIVSLVDTEELWRLNENVSREYWRNFHEQVESEKAREDAERSR